MIPLSGAARLPEIFEFRGERLVRKSELHVTLVGSRSQFDGATLRDTARDLEFKVKPSGSYRFVQKGAQRALIELVHVDDQEAYCARLETALGLPRNAVPRLPSHVTLFTEPGGRGVGVYSEAEMSTLSSAITDPAELDRVKCAAAPIWRIDGPPDPS